MPLIYIFITNGKFANIKILWMFFFHNTPIFAYHILSECFNRQEMRKTFIDNMFMC